VRNQHLLWCPEGMCGNISLQNFHVT